MVFDSKKIFNFVTDDHFSLGGEKLLCLQWQKLTHRLSDYCVKNGGGSVAAATIDKFNIGV